MTNASVRLLPLAGCVALAGCALFSSKPPLPKQAALERAGSPAAATNYRALIDQAEIIYFPQERVASGAKSEPAALLLEAVQQSAKRYAVAWTLLDASQQGVLDELQNAGGAARDEIIARLEIRGTGRAREYCRAVLRDSRLGGVRHVALLAPKPLLEKVAGGAGLAPEEREYLRGFTAPVGGFAAYAERFSGAAGYNERAIAAAYRAELLRRQFAAEVIVRQMRDAGGDARLIVFADSSDFAGAHGVPYYVAQKSNVRQLVLDREAGEPPRAPLLTHLDPVPNRSVEVVDRTPRSGGD